LPCSHKFYLLMLHFHIGFAQILLLVTVISAADI
jgi:hypothetical protein